MQQSYSQAVKTNLVKNVTQPQKFNEPENKQNNKKMQQSRNSSIDNMLWTILARLDKQEKFS